MQNATTKLLSTALFFTTTITPSLSYAVSTNIRKAAKAPFVSVKRYVSENIEPFRHLNKSQKRAFTVTAIVGASAVIGSWLTPPGILP